MRVSHSQTAARIILLLMLCLPAAAQQPIKVRTNEVLLDVVVHDKKGRVITDLRQEEIEVLEDGVRQAVTQFRPAGESSSNLVTILFDRIDPGRAQLAREVAYNFIDNSLTGGILVRVMAARQGLYLVEQFTSDKSKLRRAADRAINSTEKTLRELSDRNLSTLQSGASVEGEPAGAAETVMADSPLLARLSVDTVAQTEKTINSTRSSSPVFPLFHIARSHRVLPGRKMVLYISNGLYLNAGLSEFLKSVVSEANLANVTFYSVDMRVLPASAGNVSSRLESPTVINASRRTESSTFKEGLADSFNTNQPGGFGTNFNVFEYIDRKKELTKLGALAELTEGTGGFLITNMNDLNGALKRAASELGRFFFLSYTPQRQEADGKFRTIKVNLLRQGLKAKTRSGYFALPAASSAAPVLDYETPLLRLLQEQVVPSDFPMESALLHFESRQSEVHHILICETSLSNFIHGEDRDGKTYPAKFSILAVVRNANGEVVQKFSESHELDIPASRVSEAGRMSVSLTRDFQLAPGSYTIETIAHDRAANRYSARRKSVGVRPAPARLQTGSLYLVRGIEEINGAPQPEDDNHLVVSRARIIPELINDIQASGRNEISFHLPIHPDDKVSIKPGLQIELLRGETVVARATPELPGADERGWINFTAGLPVRDLPSGAYRLRAIVDQGQEHSEENLNFHLTGGAEAPADEAPLIAGALRASDRMSELTLTAMNASKPVQVSIPELIRGVEDNGIGMQRRLGDYTYSLRKVRRTLDRKGRIRAEEYKDYEAYPIRGRHALVQLTQNGSFLPSDRITIERRSATETLVKSEQEQGQDSTGTAVLNPFWAAGFGGFVKKDYIDLTVNPSDIFRLCEIVSPRSASLDGRETIVLDFKPREDAAANADISWITRLGGTIWIDVTDKALVRIEASEPAGASGLLNFVYQQQRLATGLWSPQLIRINSGGNETLFGGLNWDAWFEFSGFKRFDSSESEVKIVNPGKQ